MHIGATGTCWTRTFINVTYVKKKKNLQDYFAFNFGYLFELFCLVSRTFLVPPVMVEFNPSTVTGALRVVFFSLPVSAQTLNF